MSTEENKALVRRFVQIWGKGSLDTLDELAAPNFSVYYPLLRETVHGSEAFKQVLMGFHAGLPDVEVVSEDVIAEGDQVVVRWTAQGRHTGALLGVPPTGKQVTLTGITIYRLADGKIVVERGGRGRSELHATTWRRSSHGIGWVKIHHLLHFL